MTSTLTNDRSRLAPGPALVRPVLALDAAGCLLLGAAGVVAAGRLDTVLGVPTALLVVAGLALLGYGAEAALVARRPSRRGLLALAAVNALFAGGCVVTMLAATPTGWGTSVAVALTAVSTVVADVLLLGARGLRTR